jgi:HD domain
MSNAKLRRQITYEAARMLYVRQESEYYKAKLRAARRICKGWIRPDDMPTNREIRDEIQSLSRLREGGISAPPGDDAPCDVESSERIDRFALYRMLLLPLETVTQDPTRHPESDTLYHSLQVYDLARDALPYDEEFQLAALLHDVGKAIDPRQHIAAALEALEGAITERTAWLIEHHGEAQSMFDGTLGARARRRLEESADFDELELLADCDRAGRRQGVQVPDVDEALERIRDLSGSNGD